MVQIMTLVKLTALGGCVTAATITSYMIYMTKKAEERPYFKEAMEILKNHSAANKLLGLPVKSGLVDLGRSYVDDTKLGLYVNVTGSKVKGELLINAIPNEEEGWLLKRVELEMKDKAGGKVLIYDRDSAEEFTL